MNQRASPHAALVPGPLLRGGPSGGGRSWRVPGSPPESRRAANSASGGGERDSKPPESRCSSAPTPAPSLSRSEPPPRVAQSPAPPPPHTSSTAGLQLPLRRQRRPGRPWSRRCLRLHRTLAERRAPLPRSAPPREPGAVAALAAAGGAGSWAGRTGARAVPPPARGGRQAAAAADAGLGALTRPEGPAGPCVPREEAAAARAAGRLAAPSRPAWGARPVSEPVGPSVLPLPLP